MRKLNHLAKLAKSLSCVVGTCLYGEFDCIFLSCHVYAFQSESTLYSCLNVKELLARSRCDIWSLNDCNGTRTQSHLGRKRTLNHLTKLIKWLSCVVSTYLCGALEADAICKEFLDIQATVECGFTLKRVRDMIRTYSQWFHGLFT